MRDAKSGESLSQAWESGASRNLNLSFAAGKYSHGQLDLQERQSVPGNLYIALWCLHAVLGDKTQASTV